MAKTQPHSYDLRHGAIVSETKKYAKGHLQALRKITTM